MQALISPNEIVYLPDGTTGERIAQVSEQTFEVAPPLFWMVCANDVVPGLWYYDPQDQQIKLVPETPVEPAP